MQDLKAVYRQAFKDKLQKISTQKNLYYLDYALQKRLKTELQSLIKSQNSSKTRPINILFYFPLPIEFNCKKLLKFYKQQKRIQIFLPLMRGISFKIVKYRLPMSKKAFGVYEPNDSSFITPKLHYAIVPIIGIDNQFKRIGFGKGMYDRFFSTLKTKPKTIFICRALNCAHDTITQPYDLQANIFITPFALLNFKEHNNDNMANYKLGSFRPSCWRR